MSTASLRSREKVVLTPTECRCLERLQVTGNLQQERRHIQLSHGDLAWRVLWTKEKLSLPSSPLPLIGNSYSSSPSKKIQQSTQVRIAAPNLMVRYGERLEGQWRQAAQVTNNRVPVNAVSHCLAGAMCLINIGPVYLINTKRIEKSCIW